MSKNLGFMQGRLVKDEKNLEKGLFASRWFIAPVYIILAISLGIITLKVIQEFIHVVPQMFSMTVREVMLFVLHVVDLALVGNLILMILRIVHAGMTFRRSMKI